MEINGCIFFHFLELTAILLGGLTAIQGGSEVQGKFNSTTSRYQIMDNTGTRLLMLAIYFTTRLE
jgi:hypothetical protein